MSKTIKILLLTLLVLAVRGEAGEMIEGTVRDVQGAALAGANVQIRGTG